MAAQDVGIAIAQALRDVVRPLEDAFVSREAADALLLRHGWQPPDSDTYVDGLGTRFDVVGRIATLADALDEVIGQPEPSVDDVAAALTAATGVLQRVADLVSDPIPPGLEGVLASAAFWTEFPRDLYATLIADYLRILHPIAFAGLRLGGVIRHTQVPAASGTPRVDFVRADIRWSRLVDLITNPSGIAREEYGWGTSALDHRTLLGRLQEVLAALGMTSADVRPARHPVVASYYTGTNPALVDLTMLHATLFRDKDPDGGTIDVSFEVLPIPEKNNAGGTPVGLLLAPTLIGGLTANVPLGGILGLELTGGFEAEAPVRLELRPSGADVSVATPAVAIGATLRARPRDPWVLIGTPDSMRIELEGVSLSLQAEGDASSRELKLRLAADTIRLVVDPAGMDGFLSDLLAALPNTVEGRAAIVWSSKTGLTFEGSASLAFRIAIGLSVGPVLLESLGFTIGAGNQGVTAAATLTGRAGIGPVTATIEDVGVGLAMTFPQRGGNFGGANLDFGFHPPTGVGLSVDAHGVLTGGGFLQHDVAAGTYGGVLQLSLHDEITLTAYGLIATRMPDGRPGYSLLIFITAEGFKPIPLGFGFQLQSIGGMVGIHRTFDEDVLKAGLKTDSLSTLLFPRDPVANAPALLQALAASFPAKRGSYLLGLLARITWFTPTLVQMDLALILELGARTRLLVLGRVSALLPSRDNDLIRLNLDSIGVLDFDAGTLAADAVLVDSRLVHQFPVTGSAALRARWSGDTSFLLAVGGLNPHFAAPAGFPTLERVTIALCSGKNPRLICDAYLAITANTVQFGAHASLYAEAIGFSVAGDLGFDALITILPPHFLIDFHASVQLKRGSHNLFKVTLNGTLEGPLPLRIAARAKFEILWFSFTVPFEFTLASGVVPAALPAVSVVAELTKALADPANWTTRRAAALAQGVSLRPLVTGTAPVLDPLGQLVMQQQLVPLNTSRDIDTFGGAPVAGPRRMAVSATLNGRSGTLVSGAFAPARYFAMSDDDRLTAPSFETMDAGVVVGDSTTSYDEAAIVPASLDYDAITLPPTWASAAQGLAAPALVPGPVGPATPTPPRYTMPIDALQRQRPTGAAARVPARRVGRARFRNATASPAATVHPTRWRIMRVSDDAVASVDASVTTWSEYRAVLASLNRGGAKWRMVPEHEVKA